MATIREDIINIIGPKRSTTGEGNGVKSFTPQMWLVNDTDIFQLIPILLNKPFTDLFYNVSTDEYLIWDSRFNVFKPLNGVTEKIFNGTLDVVFYQDEFCEIRWNATSDQPQFRLKGNIGWFDTAYWLTPGNSSAIRNDSQDIAIHNDLVNWSAWFYWSNSGNYVANNDMGLYGSHGTYLVHQESQVQAGDTNLPTYELIIMKGDNTKITTKVTRILNK